MHSFTNESTLKVTAVNNHPVSKFYSHMAIVGILTSYTYVYARTYLGRMVGKNEGILSFVKQLKLRN